LALDLGPRRHGECDVDAGTMLGVLRTDRGSDGRAPVAALRAVTRVAQPFHQCRPGTGDAIDAPARRLGFGRKTEAGQGRTDDMGGVRRIAAVRRRIDERFDDLMELDHRAWPAMSD